jgi:hypothetical protein
VFLPGDGPTASPEPSFSGPQTLRVEPAAIPAALKAFTVAHERVSARVKELGGLSIKPWANDEVSSETATQFQQRSQGGGTDSAIECLVGYQTQLDNACKALKASQARYEAMEGTNSERWGIYD